MATRFILKGKDLTSLDSSTNYILLGALYLCQTCTLLIILMLYRSTTKSDVTAFLSSPSGGLLLIASLGFVVSVVIIAHMFLRSRQRRSKQFLLTLALNLAVVMTVISIGEVTLRLLSVRTPLGIFLGNTLLHPREWPELIKHFSGILQKAASKPTYLVFDDVLGWTVGPNRRSEDGLYLSSVEGIRSSRNGIAYADRPSTCRVALVGDSFTFGDEVKFEDTWGYQLEQALPSGCQVLNFGVSGYGVDQMYQRYQRDVLPWHPNIVILGFITHDVRRTMRVYNFIGPGFSDYPWAKPRFVLRNQKLELLNVPLVPPEEIFSKRLISDLPFVDYDLYYRTTEWDRPYWQLFHRSYLFRFLVSLHPPWEVPREQVSERVLELLNRALLHSFVALTSSEGSIPILVFFPADGELPSPAGWTPLGLKILQNAGLAHTDLTPCLKEFNLSDIFVNGGNGHYSPLSNAAVAKCLREVVVQHLSEEKRGSDRKM